MTLPIDTADAGIEDSQAPESPTKSIRQALICVACICVAWISANWIKIDLHPYATLPSLAFVLATLIAAKTTAEVAISKGLPGTMAVVAAIAMAQAHPGRTVDSAMTIYPAIAVMASVLWARPRTRWTADWRTIALVAATHLYAIDLLIENAGSLALLHDPASTPSSPGMNFLLGWVAPAEILLISMPFIRADVIASTAIAIIALIQAAGPKRSRPERFEIRLREHCRVLLWALVLILMIGLLLRGAALEGILQNPDIAIIHGTWMYALPLLAGSFYRDPELRWTGFASAAIFVALFGSWAHAHNTSMRIDTSNMGAITRWDETSLPHISLPQRGCLLISAAREIGFDVIKSPRWRGAPPTHGHIKAQALPEQFAYLSSSESPEDQGGGIESRIRALQIRNGKASQIKEIDTGKRFTSEGGRRSWEPGPILDQKGAWSAPYGIARTREDMIIGAISKFPGRNGKKYLDTYSLRRKCQAIKWIP